MTLEEAKQLKPGDRVLVEAKVRAINGNTIDAGNVRIALNVRNLEHDEAWPSVRCEDIREKITIPSRGFQTGDIVRYYDDLREVECFNPVPMVGLADGGDDPEWVEASEVELVCAVEDRADRKEEV